MKTLAIVLAASLAALVPATAYAATAPAAAAGSCDNPLKTPVQCGIWVLKCVGDSLGGNACHEDAPVAAAASPPEACDVVDCGKVIGVVRCVGDALGGHACHGEAEADAAVPDPEAILACVGTAIQNMIDGITPEMCPV